MIKASRSWLVAIAFVAAAVLAGPLLLLWDLGVAYGSVMLHRANPAVTGIGAAAGGVSVPVAVVVPLLCGAIGAISAHARLKR